MMPARGMAARLVALAAVTTGFTATLQRRRRQRGDHRVFVLEYHDVSAGPEFEGTISRQRFHRHVRYLKHHYRIETFARAAARLATPTLGHDVVALTFDDGYAGNVQHAWPVLNQEDVLATIFLTTGFLDGQGLWFDTARRSLRAAASPPTAASVSPEVAESLRRALVTWPPRDREATMKTLKAMAPDKRDKVLSLFRQADLDRAPAAEPLTWDDARRMREAGLEMGAHTVTHPVLPTLDLEGQRREIKDSRQRIAEATGILPETFSYPNGDFNDDSLRVVRELGFTAACTTRKGSNRPRADLTTLRRIGIGSDPNFLLAARLSGLFDEEMRQYLKR